MEYLSDHRQSITHVASHPQGGVGGNGGITNGKPILLYDVNDQRLSRISKRLLERGFSCSTAKSTVDCIREILSGDYGILFVGRTEDSQSLIEIISHARERDLEVFPYDLFDYPHEGQVLEHIVNYIENTVGAGVGE